MFDPSAPGMTKQMMLDWLRINYPKCPVATNTLKSSVAEMVRKKQPKFFANPESDAPGVMPGTSDTPNQSQAAMLVSPQSSPQPTITAEQLVDRPDSPTSSVPSNTTARPLLLQEVPKPPIVPERQVKRSGSPTSSAKPSKRVNFALPIDLPQEPRQPSIPPERQLKRSGSPTSSQQVAKRANYGDEVLPPIRRKPTKKETKRGGKSYPFLDSPKTSNLERRKSIPAVHDSRIDLLDSASKADLKALQCYEVEPFKSSETSNGIPSNSNMTGIDDLINSTKTPMMQDLIDLSGVDLLGVEDLGW